jgi:hypothetical protein
MMMAQIRQRVAACPPAVSAHLARIFDIDVTHGAAVVPATMEEWATRQFGALDAVRDQLIVRITNRYTLEASIFNPLRAARPAQGRSSDAAIDAWIAAELAAFDPFADPLRDTPANVFGRIIGRSSVSAANVAQFAEHHGLVIFDAAHPLHFDHARLADAFDVARRWFIAAHAYDPGAIVPVLIWNCLPRSGASLAHGHMQLVLHRGMPYARREAWRRAEVLYQAHGDYLTTLAAVHQALDLAIPMPGATVFAHLTPLRAHELIGLLEPPPFDDDDAGDYLADVVAPLLQRLIVRCGTRSFNLALAFPPLRPGELPWPSRHTILRIGDRGDALAARNDWAAMELYATGCIATDPFHTAARLR